MGEKTSVTTVCEPRQAREYLVTTTGLSMHYQPKDFVLIERALCDGGPRSNILGLPLLRVP